MSWLEKKELSAPGIMGRREICRTVMRVDVGSWRISYVIRSPLIIKGSRCNDGQRAGVGLSTCLCIHAEENALLEAGRERIREGSTLYCDT